MYNSDENKFVELLGRIPNVAVQGYDKDRNVIYWNKASEDMYKYTKDEAFGKKIEDLIIPDLIKKDVIAAHYNWCKNGVPIPSGEITLINKDGANVYVYSSHVMLSEDSEYPEMFCIDVNLTKEKEKEIELKKKDKILTQQSKMAAMGEMLDNIAHQWRQPLSMISSVASGVKLKKDFGELTNEYIDDSVDSIVDTTKYLSQTIDDFRDFIKGTHNKKVFNLFDNLSYSLRLLDGFIKKNEIKVIVSTSLDTVNILGYPNELVQVIINIVSNSKDAFEEHKIKDKYIFCDIHKEEGSIFLKIKDNGKGIDENIIEKVFDANFTTKKGSKGTGIGLYMSQKLVTESMNGKIKVSNVSYEYKGNDFKGSLFEIILPIDK